MIIKAFTKEHPEGTYIEIPDEEIASGEEETEVEQDG